MLCDNTSELMRMTAGSESKASENQSQSRRLASEISPTVQPAPAQLAPRDERDQQVPQN